MIDGAAYALGFTYDSADRPLSLSYPAQSAETVNLAYTAQGLPGRLYSSVDYVQSSNAVYDVAGRLTQLKLGKQSGNSNPVVQAGFSYYPWTTISGQGRLQQLTAGIPGNLSSLQNLTYAYDAVGNVDWIKDWKAGNPQIQDFTVDRLNRLINAVASGGANGNYGAETYGYSTAGNLTSKTGVGLYGYGAQASSCPEGALVKKHAVVTAGSNSYCYDQNGNQRRRTVGGSTYTLIYDAENRLVSVSGAATASFTYDADGNRIKSVVNGETTIFVGSLYEKKLVGSTTTHTKYYTFGGRRIAVRVAGILSWLLSDHLGSTAVTADGATGGRTGELWYKPWGESRGTPYGVTPTTYRFTGQREDASTGLYFYNARYYDPALGRFISADTIVPQPGNPQSLNRYGYALNNALRYADPSGHYSDNEIQQYLKDMYHQNWESFWKAWLTDPYWIWVLHTAQDGYLLHTDQGGNVTFNHKDGSFTLDHGELHEYQGKGVYALYDNHMNLVEDGEWLHYGSQAGTLGLILQNPETVYYQPLYDYSSGIPVFRAWQKIQAQWTSQFVWTFGTGEPWLLMAAGQVLSQWGPTAAAGSFVTGVGSGWGIVTLIDAITVNIADEVSYSVITDWPPRAAVCSPPQPIPAYYQWPNPNGVAYPAPWR